MEKQDKSDQIWNKLLYLNRNFSHQNYMRKKREKLIKGQNPHTVIISCSDSRVPPEIIFGVNLGELFVIRIAGNIVDLSVISSMEYALEHLSPYIVVVMGHEECGAVQATIDYISGKKISTSPYIIWLASTIAPGIKSIENAPYDNVNNTIKELLYNSDILRNSLRSKKIKLIGAIYNLNTGIVTQIK